MVVSDADGLIKQRENRMIIKIKFDEKKVMDDCKAYVLTHIPDISKDGFLDAMLVVVTDSIKSTIKVTTEKEQLFKED